MRTKKIWGTLSSFFPPKKEGLLGINIANDRFIQALLKYSHFDELHFFLTNPILKKDFEELYADSISCFSGTLRFFGRFELPEQLEKNLYTVFHFSDQQVHMHDFSYIRNRYASFPITAFMHSLSYCSTLSFYGRFHHGGLGRCDAIICSSEVGKQVIDHQLAETARKQGKSPSPIQRIVIPLGMEDISISVPKDVVRKKLKLPKDVPIALCMGRFSEYDKMDLVPLLQAMSSIRDPSVLVLAGNVQNEEYFSILQLWVRLLKIEHRVFFFQSPSEGIKKGLFRSADFFISIADNPQETFGLSLVEAMSAGLALLVSDYNGYKELCTEDIGIRVPTSWVETPSLSFLSPLIDPAMLHRQLAQSLALDNRKLREGLGRLFSDAIFREKLGRAAREKFLSCYHTPVVIAQLEALWERLHEEYIPPPKSENIMEMDYFGAFAHYPTHWLSMDMELQDTEFSRWWRSQGVDYPILTGMYNFVKKDCIEWIWSQMPSSVHALESMWEGDRDLLFYTIQWMRKQDLLEIAE